MRRALFVFLFAGLLCALPAHAVEYTYTTIDVSCPAAVSAGASGINRHGQIVGTYTDSVGTQHGFLLTAGTCLTIDGPDGSLATSANGLNDHGQIVGSYEDQPGRFRGFLYDHGVATPLPVVPDADSISWLSAYGINNRGQIVGAYRRSDTQTTHGFVLHEGTYTTVNAPYTEPFTPPITLTAINHHGRMVGHGDGDLLGGFLYYKGTLTVLNLPGANPSGFPFGINDRLQIVGSFYESLEGV
jgi:probable HAF family extracellular repeat protein